MKHRFTLAQKMTGSIAIAVVVQIVCLTAAFVLHFKPELRQQTDQLIKKGSLAAGKMHAYEWHDDIVQAVFAFSNASKSEAILQRFADLLAQNPEYSGVALYRVNDSKVAEKKIFTFREGLTQVVKSGVFTESSEFTSKIARNLTSPTQSIDSQFIFTGVPVRAHGKVVALMVFAESMEVYNQAGRNISKGMSRLILLFLLAQLAVIFWLSRRAGRPLHLLAQTAAEIAAGDLTRKIQIPVGAVTEVAALSTAIQDMSNAIHEQVSLIKALTLQASGVSQNVSRAMSHLASSAAQQAAAVAQTATTVEEMEKSGKAVAEAVKRIVEAAVRSAEASTRGRDAVNTANSIIVRIKDDSANLSSQSRTLLSHVEEVGNIINSVNTLAEQSKILAVNASIEAAKAGEYGSGFAVVAQEVKNLAGESKEATEQITRTLTSIRQSVEAMVRLARDGEERTFMGVSSIANTGAIVNDLSDAIQEASEVAAEIDSSVEQQSTGLSQIASAMDEINISASENQQISKKMESNTSEMTTALDELRVLVDVWTTFDSASR